MNIVVTRHRCSLNRCSVVIGDVSVVVVVVVAVAVEVRFASGLIIIV